MSALLTSRPRAREERRAAGQELLFGDAPAVVERPVAERPPAGAAIADTAAPPTAPVPATGTVAAPAGGTLDAAITSLWHRLTAGEASACPVCEAPMEPVHTTGTGVAGGRCRSCGSTLS
jgi:hypothetical protein